MQLVAAGDFQQAIHLLRMLAAIAPVPQPDIPHDARHQQAKAGDGAIGRHAELGEQAVHHAQAQNARLLVEVLHGNRAARAHQAVATVLQQPALMGNQPESAQPAQHNQKGRGQPDGVDEVHAHHQQAHGNAQRNDLGGAVKSLHAHGCQHRAHRRTNGHHAHQRRRVRGAVAQRHGAPGQHDVAQIARHAPEQGGGGQRDLAQLVPPQAVVALPEIRQQRQDVGKQAARRVLAQRHQRGAGARNVDVEPGRDRVKNTDHADGRFGGQVDRGVDARHIPGQQPARNRRAHQHPAQQHAQDDGGDRQTLDPAIGAHQLAGRQQLGQDALSRLAELYLQSQKIASMAVSASVTGADSAALQQLAGKTTPYTINCAPDAAVPASGTLNFNDAATPTVAPGRHITSLQSTCTVAVDQAALPALPAGYTWKAPVVRMNGTDYAIELGIQSPTGTNPGGKAQPVPTLSGWGLAALGAMFGLVVAGFKAAACKPSLAAWRRQAKKGTCLARSLF
ncbi:hypothetical protein FQA39_LY19198 [Lamprigera yunnana]|nr:hypothetical protein FQA39_LY19198 [Lamprigera yunnana]